MVAQFFFNIKMQLKEEYKFNTHTNEKYERGGLTNYVI